MSDLTSYVESIFIENQYEISDIINENKFRKDNEFDKIAVNMNEGKVDYYFIISVKVKNNISNFYDYINLRIEELLENVWNAEFVNEYDINPDFKKNSSLLILLEIESLEQEDFIRNSIYDIEESALYFKRYIITYTNKQVLQLIKDINDDGNIIEFMDNLIKSPTLFDNYKKNRIAETVYNLVAKLYIKIPFLQYKVEEISISSLKETINSELKSQGLDVVTNDIITKNCFETGDYSCLLSPIDVDDDEIKEKLEELMGKKI
jgi:hypothetical protein